MARKLGAQVEGGKGERSKRQCYAMAGELRDVSTTLMLQRGTKRGCRYERRRASREWRKEGSEPEPDSDSALRFVRWRDPSGLHPYLHSSINSFIHRLVPWSPFLLRCGPMAVHRDRKPWIPPLHRGILTFRMILNLKGSLLTSHINPT